MTNEQAFSIVQSNPELKSQKAAREPDTARWLLGADAHVKWKSQMAMAVNSRDLTLLDYPSLLPISPEALRALLESLHHINQLSAIDTGQAAAEPLQTQTNKKTPQFRNKGLLQIEAIVAELERLGYKPLRLPALVAGQRSAKAEVVDNLDGKGLFTARKAFDNAWQEATRRSYIKNEN